MKKNLLPVCSMLLFFLLLLTSCKKENFFKKDTCRLERWQGLDDGYLRTLHYNDQGLLDEWKEMNPQYDIDQLSTYEYDHNKKLTRMKLYDHNKFINTVILVYERGRIEKELWYVADTQTLEDTVVNTYNSKGRIVKRESFYLDAYALFTYDTDGNVINAEVKGTDGTLYGEYIQSFDKPVKEPMMAVPGLPYPIPYLNYMLSKLKYTYLKDFGLDAEGNVVTFYELDPEKSTLREGPERYATYYKTFDKVSGLSNRQIWEYQNCDCDDKEGDQQLNMPAFKGPTTIGKNQRPPYISMIQLKEQIKQIRKRNRK